MGNIIKRASSEDAKDNTSTDKPEGLEARYMELAFIRAPFLERAREASRYTIPSLLPPEGHTGSTKLYKPWQSIGPRGVNNLGAKILLALLPANTPFFRFLISQFQLDKLQGQDALRTKLEEGLSRYEKELMNEVETGTTRVSAFEAILHLIVAGNALAYLPLKGGMKVYHLDSYVVLRDGMGQVLEIITQEMIGRSSVPEDMRGQVHAKCKDTEKTIKLHTVIRREGKRFVTYQEIKAVRVPGSNGSYPVDASPYIPLRWVKIDGEDYGRGHVESLMGDLRSADGLRQAIVEGSVAAAKVLFFVNPNGVTKQKTVAEAPNGAVRTGKAEDVSCLQMEKFNDFRTAQESFNSVKADLEASFLMSATRDAERVTAEEIRLHAAELESALGGVYSLLAQEFQLPLVTRLMAQMVKQGRLKPLPKGIVRPTIVTGLEALSRGSDLQRLDMFISGVAQYGPEVVERYVNYSDLFARRATALGIDKKGLIKGDDEVAQAQQQAQAQSAIQSLGPHAIKAATEMAKQNPQGLDPNAQAQGAGAAG